VEWELAMRARALGIRLRCHLDDWLILSQSAETCACHTQQVLQLASSLGFKVNLNKCDLVPSQELDYLDMAFPTKTRKSLNGTDCQTQSLGVKSHAQVTELLGGNKVAFVQIDLEHWRHEADCHALPAHNWPADTLAPALKH
jgi:hypothetical protein